MGAVIHKAKGVPKVGMRLWDAMYLISLSIVARELSARWLTGVGYRTDVENWCEVIYLGLLRGSCHPIYAVNC